MSKHYRSSDDNQLAEAMAAHDQALADRGYDKDAETALFRWACGFTEMEDDPALLSCAAVSDFASDRHAEMEAERRDLNWEELHMEREYV